MKDFGGLGSPKIFQEIEDTLVESTFGTIRYRTKRSKGRLSRDSMLYMMFKLGLCAEKNWRRFCGLDYLTKVVTGIKFKDGVEVTEVDQVAA
ncbi:MAG: hypothetical protein KZQ66_15050 [Candidatus Thiodiazotropha sp. (ex Lucinoma aequizonata)]|nr:hypothetical protein [Candidatus Thiodiazotropha sp. (ex Lucinoma aequizonata)]MCU7887343.1 hypothetical protein [Candidatus Thiodiazotropha sp. (ex Lucinoma aequizonata)]MCU7894473.1 hypothetical protein [Candidatus Thiodiazotropha sp. (ex Lucinoma aequizonata)]MCU7900259.1 hypothetical protein [Candidatus Thiodiazotropha sp. (ex Lucinoma aequizonata)]MCU7903151.1 hypothetical protein [Candidatus Thiodiazotropha sp. (ex Lucinoma aequizonata)]